MREGKTLPILSVVLLLIFAASPEGHQTATKPPASPQSKFILSFEIYHYDTRTPANSRLIHREVVRLVTPGTLLEPLKPDANYLMSIAQGPDSSLGLAWLDLSTGEFHLGVSSLENLEEDLSRINPAEVGGVVQA